MSAEGAVYVVDDDPSVARALTRLLRVAGLPCQAFVSAEDFLAYQPEPGPACLILDVRLPDQNGLAVQQELLKRGSELAVVFISGHADVATAVQAMRAGAVHFLPKPFENRELLGAVRGALAERQAAWQQQRERERLVRQLEVLTPRERDIFDLVAHGLPNKSIATRLNVSLQTVKLYRGRIMKKLELQSAADLVRLAEKTKSAGR